MILQSFVRDTLGLSPVDVEVVLQKGLPKIEILGLADRGLQESLLRIQSAITNQGFVFPKAHKVVVNIRPIEIKKSSLGLELSIALAILHLTGQKHLPVDLPFYVYGELSLSGEIKAPKDLELIPVIHEKLITGFLGDEAIHQEIEVHTLLSLNGDYCRKDGAVSSPTFFRPQPRQKKMVKSAARLLEIVAVGEHSLLLAGPSGTGKTTFAQQLMSYLREPNISEWWDIRRIGKIFDEQRTWRPCIMPHHSISVASMLGGGNQAKPGAIFKAHGGVLVLDELLEFHPTIQSALREPMEQKTITISKNTHHHKYNSMFVTVGATNLCRCGAFVPKSSTRCRCTSLELRRYLDRLSGPFLDRFSVFEFTQKWSCEKEHIDSDHILQNIERGVHFSKARSLIKNEDMTEQQLLIDVVEKKENFPVFRSWRRYLSFLRVARTIADLEQSKQINKKHLFEAYDLTAKNHSSLETLFC